MSAAFGAEHRPLAVLQGPGRRGGELLRLRVQELADREHRSLGTGRPIPEGKVLNATFELNGREYRAFDGGDHFTFTDGFSLIAICRTQRELDEVWDKLASGGGQEGPCGWVTDRFGVSKLDIKTLEAAYKER